MNDENMRDLARVRFEKTKELIEKVEDFLKEQGILFQ